MHPTVALSSHSTPSHTLTPIVWTFLIDFAEPKPPTDVSWTVIGKDTAVVTWSASRSMCDNVVGNYSVRYRLTDTSVSSSFTTVYTTTTSVVLQGLVPDAEYTVSVTAINSQGDMSAPSTTTMGNPTGAETQSKSHHITTTDCCCFHHRSVMRLYFCGVMVPVNIAKIFPPRIFYIYGIT